MNFSKMDDAELLQLMQMGDQSAFAEIYHRYWKLVLYTANNILQNLEVAKDAVQEVFISLWQRRNQVAIAALKPYLQQAVRFQVLKQIKAQRVDEHFYNRLAEVSARMVYENPLLAKEQEIILGDIMQALPDDCREIFKLSREEGLTYKQIASLLNISEKTVEKKMSLSLKHLRAAFKQNFSLAVSVLLCYNL
jgi:RNA polymerase sigma-70 factor (ECF subfamily)